MSSHLSNTGTATAHKTIKKSGVIVSDESVSTSTEDQVSSPCGYVTFTQREVVNTGNFETTTIEVGVTLPIGISIPNKDLEVVFTKARKFVTSHLEEDILALREAVDRGRN